MTLPWLDIALHVRAAGFTSEAAARAVALTEPESRRDPEFRGTAGNEPPGSVDRGLWAINSHWHAEVPDPAAFDPARAAAHVYRISRGGTDFSAWVAHERGLHQPYLPIARAVLYAAERVEREQRIRAAAEAALRAEIDRRDARIAELEQRIARALAELAP